MKRMIATVVGLMLGATLASPAHATESPKVECLGVEGWYVNPDELDRKPEPTKDGFVFEGDALIHHAVTMPVADLEPGTFDVAPGSDAPDQPSFFSVEVNGEGVGKYGTLRWNVLTGKWNMVANGGTFYENEDPAKVVEAAGKGSTVFSFGVGYTKNPPGTAVTTVSSVKFAGKTYSLKCEPTPEPTKTSNSPSPSPSASTTASASPSASTSSNAAGGVAAGGTDEPSLPITGVNAGAILGVALLLVGLGGAAIAVAVRRRRIRFDA